MIKLEKNVFDSIQSHRKIKISFHRSATQWQGEVLAHILLLPCNKTTKWCKY